MHCNINADFSLPTITLAQWASSSDFRYVGAVEVRNDTTLQVFASLHAMIDSHFNSGPHLNRHGTSRGLAAPR
jgi:hypothetical protein